MVRSCKLVLLSFAPKKVRAWWPPVFVWFQNDLTTTTMMITMTTTTTATTAAAATTTTTTPPITNHQSPIIITTIHNYNQMFHLVALLVFVATWQTSLTGKPLDVTRHICFVHLKLEPFGTGNFMAFAQSHEVVLTSIAIYGDRRITFESHWYFLQTKQSYCNLCVSPILRKLDHLPSVLCWMFCWNNPSLQGHISSNFKKKSQFADVFWRDVLPVCCCFKVIRLSGDRSTSSPQRFSEWDGMISEIDIYIYMFIFSKTDYKIEGDYVETLFFFIHAPWRILVFFVLMELDVVW